MSQTIFRRIILPIIIVTAGFGCIVALSGLIAANRPVMPDSFADSDLGIHGSRLKGFALGMEGLLADWYWMRSLQYIGDKMVNRENDDVNLEDLSPLNPRLLYPLLENTTNLDPHFIAAYSYGAIVLPAIDSEKAIQFAKKGIADNPTEWRLYQHLGFIYWRLGRYDTAAETYEQGSLIPGSSPFMKLMAASMRSEGGSRSTARAIYRQMLAESGDEAVRITAERRLKRLDAFDEREAIDEILAAFKNRAGHCPENLSEIMPFLRPVKLPDGGEFRINASSQLIDPTGAPYMLDKENCSVKLHAEQTPLPVN